MSKLQLENYFSTALQNVVEVDALGEIEFQLLQEPKSNFGFLVVNYENKTTREEIFYHRKDGTSVFTYATNRKNPQDHEIGESVLLNDTASVFNYITGLLPNHFFIYKTSDTTCIVKGGKVFDEGVYKNIPDNSTLNLEVGINYLFLEGNLIDSSLTLPTDKYTIGEIIVDNIGDITSHETYNTIGLTGKQGIQGDQGIQGIQGIPGDPGEAGASEAINVLVNPDGFINNLSVADDTVQKALNTLDSLVLSGTPLPTYSLTNVIEQRTLDADNYTSEDIINVLGTLIDDAKDGLKGDNGVGVPSGGEAGQVLSKISIADNDTQWISPVLSGDVDGGNF